MDEGHANCAGGLVVQGGGIYFMFKPWKDDGVTVHRDGEPAKMQPGDWVGRDMITLIGVMVLNMGLILRTGRAQACHRAWRGVAVMLAFLGTLAVAGCSSSSSGDPPAAPVSSAEPAYPVRPGPIGRYLVDQQGVPFLMLGESPQAMIGNLSEADAELFLSNRQSHGFNTVWINLLCASYTGCNANGTTFDGIAPFTVGNDLSTYDLSAPNEVYFARANRILQLAEKYGFLVVLDPAETGSWLSVLQSNGLAKARAYGQYVGTRYKDFPNIVWMSGNDFQSWSTPSNDALVQAVALGIKDTDPTHIHTVELEFPLSSSLDDNSWAPILSLNATYTQSPTYAEVLHGYNQSASLPVFMVEANYEFENNTGMDPSTPAILRRQEYWSALSGSTGQLFGNHYTSFFLSGWKAQLDTPGAVQMGYVKALFAPRAWYELVPDQAHIVVTAGYGTFSSTGSIGANDYVTAARTPSGKLIMAYVPSARIVTVVMSQLSGPATARWYDPVVGSFTNIAGSPFANTGSRDFTTPGTMRTGPRIGCSSWRSTKGATNPKKISRSNRLKIPPLLLLNERHVEALLLPRCYQDGTTQAHQAPPQKHPLLWFLVGLGCLRLGYRKFVNRRSPGLDARIH